MYSGSVWHFRHASGAWADREWNSTLSQKGHLGGKSKCNKLSFPIFNFLSCGIVLSAVFTISYFGFCYYKIFLKNS